MLTLVILLKQKAILRIGNIAFVKNEINYLKSITV